VLVGGTLLVGVFDPEQELAARATRVQPVEKGRARATDV
jgi:hypothetical protein